MRFEREKEAESVWQLKLLSYLHGVVPTDGVINFPFGSEIKCSYCSTNVVQLIIQSAFALMFGV